jgi:nitrate reductase gamma subunit
MRVIYALLALGVLVLVVFLGAGAAKLHYLFGVIIPYAAIVIFLIGLIYRLVSWASSAVPFRIPTTCGQQKTLSWIKSSKLDNPTTGFWAVARMALEILCFRSLFRNTRAKLKGGPRLVYTPDKWLWFSGLAFHYSFLVIFLRHFRFFAEPVPSWVLALHNLDAFFQVGLPLLLVTDVIVVLALTFLFLRRVVDPKLRYLSLASDYFPLFLLLGVTLSGIWVRYFSKTDLLSVKQLAMGLISFHPVVPDGISSFFFFHLFLVCVLFAYFPYSKLMHFAGVFLSPTRNLANNNRSKRHVNPWDYPVAVHTYAEYEDEFRELMKEADMPVEKE